MSLTPLYSDRRIGGSIDQYRFDLEMQTFFDHTKIKRKAIIELAHSNTVVTTIFQYWKKSQISWEDFLTAAVCELSKQNASLLESAVMSKQLEPASVIEDKLDH